jgi:hypothetical protein
MRSVIEIAAIHAGSDRMTESATFSRQVSGAAVAAHENPICRTICRKESSELAIHAGKTSMVSVGGSAASLRQVATGRGRKKPAATTYLFFAQ